MIFRQLTSTGDWTFGAGLGNYASGNQAIILNLDTSIKMWQGDFFTSLSGWINWKGLMNYGKKGALDAALQNLIAKCYGIVGLTSASVVLSPTTQLLSATYSVDTVYTQSFVRQVQILSGQ